VEAAFLRQILENPEDLSARRVFADWLMEQPEPERRDRGEFIALQCELAGKVKPGSRRVAMEDRAGELFARYGETWAAPVRRFTPWYTFRHGMVESVQIDVPKFLREGEELLRLAPVTELIILLALEYSRRWEEMRDLAGSPLLQRITSLDLSRCYLNGDALAHLLQSPHPTRLRRLNLDNCPVGDEGMLALTGSPYFGQLTHLRLVRSRVGTEGIRLLLRIRIIISPACDCRRGRASSRFRPGICWIGSPWFWSRACGAGRGTCSPDWTTAFSRAAAANM
jgi:uncharacterized protein (TIGR02996 family)